MKSKINPLANVSMLNLKKLNNAVTKYVSDSFQQTVLIMNKHLHKMRLNKIINILIGTVVNINNNNN